MKRYTAPVRREIPSQRTNLMIEKFKTKTREELDNQLGRVESIIGSKIEPESIRTELLSMDLDQLKTQYPREYQIYSNILKTEAQILNFPDLKREGDDNPEKPQIKVLPTGTRGNSFKIDFPNESHVIKPLESLAEKDIAQKVSELGIGPKQFKSKEGFLHEEFIEGSPLLEIKKEKCTPEFMEDIGKKFAKALKKLHEQNILVNDQILTNDFGKSHMIIDKNGEARFIDFGASIEIGDYPNISDEGVVSLMRTDPFMAFRVNNVLDPSKEEVKLEIKGYRENILSQFKTKQELINWKDMQLLNEGIFFLNGRLPNVQAFVQGIKKEQL